MLEVIGFVTIVGGLFWGVRWLVHHFDAWLAAIIEGVSSR